MSAIRKHAPVVERPQLAVVPPVDPWAGPRPHGPAHWWFLAREAAGTATYHVATFVMAHVATRRSRERAWLAGYGFALGAGPPGYWLTHAPEYTAGNEAGWELRHSHGDNGVGRCQLAVIR